MKLPYYEKPCCAQTMLLKFVSQLVLNMDGEAPHAMTGSMSWIIPITDLVCSN